MLFRYYAGREVVPSGNHRIGALHLAHVQRAWWNSVIRYLSVANSHGGRLSAYAACAVVSALYQSFYAFGYYPVTEGWFSEYSHLMRDGAVPYRDFSFLLPPLYPIQIAAFQSTFGESFIALHILGIVITCAIALALMDLLCHFFNPWASALAAVLGTIFYQSGNAYVGYDFTQFVSLYLLLAAAALVRSITTTDNEKPTRSGLVLCAATGFFSALAALIKQSNGGIGAFALCAAGVIISVLLYRPRIALERFAAFCVGFSVPFIGIALWLLKNDALSAFIKDTFSRALTAKGGGSLFDWMNRYLSGSGFLSVLQILSGLFVLLVLMALIARAIRLIVSSRLRGSVDREGILAVLKQPLSDRRRGSLWQGLVVGAAGLAALYVITLGVAHGGCPSCSALHTQISLVRGYLYSWSAIAYFVGSVVALVALWKSRSLGPARFFAVSLFGLGLVFGNGMSSGLSEISAYYGIAMLFAFLIDAWLPLVVPSLLPVLIALLLCVPLIDQKMQKPYSWWETATPPVRTSACAEATGLLNGLCMPPDDYNAIMHISAVVKANSVPDDRIYVYPHMPVFYLLSERAPFKNAVVSWFDFTCDELSAQVNDGIQTQPPAVIVMAQIPDSVLLAHERLFRHDQRLPQRAIVASINELLAKGRLERVDETRNLNGITIDIYKRVGS